MKTANIVKLLLIGLVLLSLAGLSTIAMGKWMPGGKWWVFLVFYVSLAGLILFLRSKNRRIEITGLLVCLVIFMSAVAIHQPFHFSRISNISLQSLAAKYPAPQNDIYLLYSYLEQHTLSPMVYISNSLVNEINEEALYALGSASAVEFIEYTGESCTNPMENAEVIEGFFGQNYAFSKAIEFQAPVLFIFKEENTFHIVSGECMEEWQEDIQP